MFKISSSGNDIQSTPFKKSVSILIALMIFISLINTGLCTGPIDQIFIGWRDMTASCDSNHGSCFGGGQLNAFRDGGVFVLMASLVLIGGLFFVIKSLKIIAKSLWFYKN